MEEKTLIERIDNLSPEKKAMLNRLKRVEGQLRGIQRLIIEGSSCETVLIQLSAARKAMQNACIEVLKGHLRTCIARGENMEAQEFERLVAALIDLSPASSESSPLCQGTRNETTPN